MRIGIVGGIDRSARQLEEVAASEGHSLETHSGVVSGSASASSLRALVARADLVLVLTDVNSHNGVKIARDTARQHHTPLRIMRRLGVSNLAAFLSALPANGPAPSDQLKTCA